MRRNKDQAIAQAIAAVKSGKTTTIDIRHLIPEVTDIDMFYLLQELGEDAAVHTLIIGDGAVTDEGLKTVLKFRQLHNLSVCNNKITAEGAKLLAQVPLNYLFLGDNQIGNEGFKALLGNRTLKQLYINDNNITEIVEKDISLESQLNALNFRCNPVGDKAAIFAQLPNLVKLKVWFVGITDEGAKAFLQNKRLMKLNIGSKPDVITLEMNAKLKEHIENNRQRARDHFYETVLMLVYANQHQQDNNAPITLLPLEVIFNIFKQFDFSTIGKKNYEGQAFVEFIAWNLAEIQRRIRDKVSIQVIETKGFIGKRAYFFKQPLPAEGKKRKLEAEPQLFAPCKLIKCESRAPSAR